MRIKRGIIIGLGVMGAMGVVLSPGCDSGTIDNTVGNYDGGPPPDPCKSGGDLDNDGYGTGCAKGNDCDDSDPLTYPGAPERCDGKDNNCNGQKDEGVKNACGTCDQVCAAVGKGSPFPLDPNKDPNVKDVKGVGLDKNGDLVLKTGGVNFNYMWIANTYDPGGSSTCGSSKASISRCRGSVSKVDTTSMKEVARYYSITCFSSGNTSGCKDINGKTIDRDHNHTPSRTAVDYNFDVWVANRSVHGGQPSATKIANEPLDCVDRNKNGKIDTSKDQNKDGKITIDCDGDGKADSGSTKCKGSLAGKDPEFLGDDDECVILTVNYGDSSDVGRSICLDMGKSMVGASNAWVGTFYRPENKKGVNKYYKINGMTGKIEAEVNLPSGHHAYGCTADAHNIIWSTDIYGSLAYFKATSPYSVGAKLKAPWVSSSGTSSHYHYGIAVDSKSDIWLGGYTANWVLRYQPGRSSFSALGTGKWTRVDLKSGYKTRGVAADSRGFIWVAIHEGYIVRLAQNLPVGVHDRKSTKNIWPLKSNTVIGVGVDFKGNVWGVGHKYGYASRLDVDKAGNVTATGTSKYVKIGENPYTYSDFTGYGLMNFIRPSGRYIYQLNPCPKGIRAQWKQVNWNATTPAGTAVTVRVRSGDTDANFGPWTGYFTKSPADVSKLSATPTKPNPSYYLQVEFTLTNVNKVSSPILHDFGVAYSCYNDPG